MSGKEMAQLGAERKSIDEHYFPDGNLVVGEEGEGFEQDHAVIIMVNGGSNEGDLDQSGQKMWLVAKVVNLMRKVLNR